jgi:hypothetical protein
VRAIAEEMGVAVLAVVGSMADGFDVDGLDVLTLTDLVGTEAALTEPKRSVERVVSEWLSARA